MNPLQMSLSEMAEGVRQQKLSSRDLVEFYRGRIQKFDKEINSFISLNEEAGAEASRIDEAVKSGRSNGRLLGVPIGIKDLLCTKGLATTAGSKILSNFIPPYDCTVVSRLKEEGAIVLGKLNLDEFAMGSSNETSYFGVCRNPWNKAYVPGGSSGGSAAAVAMGLAPATIGTDTGGSIRQPASFCGVVGFKPTYGRVSRYGIVAYASSLDQAGPMTRSVADAALLSEVISGQDPLDQTTTQRKVPTWQSQLKADLKGLKVGVLKEFVTDSLHADVKKTVNAGIEALCEAGAEIVEVSVPLTKFAVPVYYLIAASEASSNLARYDGVKYGHRAEFSSLSGLDLETFYSKTRGEGFGDEVKRRIMLGTYCLSSGYFDQYYTKACQVRRLIKNEYDSAFAKCDVIVSPVTTTPAFKIGERVSDPLQMYMNDLFTTSTNLAGLPGISVPFGFSVDRLPIGVQLTGAPFAEQSLLNCASALEVAANLKGVVPYES
mgnify:CR=1 FL=1